MKRKRLTKTDVKRHELAVVAEDKGRCKKPTKDTPLWEIGNNYIAGCGKFLFRVPHEQIDEGVWELLKDHWDPQWRLADKLGAVMPAWLAALCPQAGGLLHEIEMNDAAGFVMSKKARRTLYVYEGVSYSIPFAQYELVKAFHPEMICYTGPTLEGADLFGDPVNSLQCPVVCRVKGVGAVGLIMPMAPRLVRSI